MNIKQEWSLLHTWVKWVIVSLFLIGIYLIIYFFVTPFWAFWGTIIVVSTMGTIKYGFAEKK